MNNFQLNKNNLVIHFDTENEHWYILFPKHGQYASGSFNENGFERIHHPITVATRTYELVLDPNDKLNAWDNWSVFDCKKECYIDNVGGKIK